MDSPYSAEVRVCVEAIRKAAQISESVISHEDKGVVEKDDLSPVTVADFAIQALLVSVIHVAFPSDRFVGEESSADLRADPALLNRVWSYVRDALPRRNEQQDARLPQSPEQMCDMIDWCGNGEPGGDGRVWIFDPIDGTKTFVRGEMYAINIALLDQGTQMVGVVGCPKLAPDAEGPISNNTTDPTGQGSIIFAVRGHGTYVQALTPNGITGTGTGGLPRRIALHAEAAVTTEDLRSVSCVNLLDSGVEDVHKLVAAQLGVVFPGCDLLGWVPRWVSLALGLSNMTVWVYKKRERSGKIWDHAGAMLMFEEVGGKITDVDGKDIQLTMGRKMTANHGFVAAPRHLHHLVLSTLQKTLREQGKGHLLASTT